MPRKLLVADKSVVIQKSVGITFAQEDCTVTYVSDGEEALQKIKQFKPDIALVHINLPKMSGYDVCEAVKKDPNAKSTPILLFVGTHEALDEARFKTCGAEGSIIKPFESQALIDRVGEILARPVAQPSPPVVPTPPPVSAPTPSPNATIAGQAPLKPPAPVPPPAPTISPASTIAGQSPLRDAPLLDLDVEVPTPPAKAADEGHVFEFSLDDSFTAHAQEESPPPVMPTAAQDASSGGDFWDFAESSTIATSVVQTPELSSPQVSEPPPAEEEFAFATPTTDEPTQTFDLSAEPEPSFEPAALDFSPAEPEPIDVSPMEASESSESFVEPLAAFVGPEEDETGPVHAQSSSTNSAGSPTVALSDEQMEAIVSKVFSKVIERIAWEVVPGLAETIIKEELARLTKE